MSESDGTSVWVGDLDRCISIDSIDLSNQREALIEVLGAELGENGELQLLAGKAISARLLFEKGISPSEWRHALHQSEMTIGVSSLNLHKRTDSPVTQFLKGLLDLGRPYAIARYARWERLDYPSALTSTVPHGLRALVNQLLASEGIARTRQVDTNIQKALKPCENGDVIAYRQAGVLQSTLHQIAGNAPNHPGGAYLNRNRMRDILSFARLYFSTIELKVNTIEELRFLLENYALERVIAQHDDARLTTNGRHIRSWRLRHVQPLINLYPYAIRHGLKRALAHEPPYFDRTALVNELALAHCGIFRMRAAGEARARASK
ncbi:hypothetical protein [Aquabacterium sp.]|uniref:hypothetical protein n=1 Tax=Aquabacterium sp. TaxID=1872578 RepID=UPI002639FD2A|nr:hypothetical protein [Aquabacterium sp.]MDD2976106.1 hypothetical protein [Aquabacterium sp.]